MKRIRCLRLALRARSASPRAAFVAVACLVGGATWVACSSDETQRPSRGSGGSAGASADAAPAEAGTGGANDGTANGDASAMPDVSVVPDAANADADASLVADASVIGDVAVVDVRSEPLIDVRANDTAIADARVDSPGDASSEAPTQGTVDAGPDAAVDVQDAPTGPNCPLLIDDMEATFGHINDGCRNGFWFTYNDGVDAGAQQPPPGLTFLPTTLVPPRGASTMAARTSGSGHAFAGLGLNFNSPPAGVTRTYDASAYAGITFFAMGSGIVSVLFPDRDTDPSGLVCATVDRAQCNDHFGKTIALTSAWQQYTVLFTDLRQQGFGYPPPGGFDKSAVFGVLWQATGSASFDIWIDDLAFVVPGDVNDD